MSYDQCGAEHGKRGMRCGLPIGHKGAHEDYWGKKFVADVRRAPGQGQEPTGSKAGPGLPWDRILAAVNEGPGDGEWYGAARGAVAATVVAIRTRIEALRAEETL